MRFHQLLQRSFGFRLLLAAGAAVLLLAVVNRWENCRSNRFAAGCLVADAGGIVSVGNVESLSIVTAAFLFVLEAGKRRQQDNIEAMEVILTCQQAGAKMSFARNSALEMLTASGLWLDGLDLSHAQLDEVQAPHGHWREVNLHRASLRGANPPHAPRANRVPRLKHEAAAWRAAAARHCRRDWIQRRRTR